MDGVSVGDLADLGHADRDVNHCARQVTMGPAKALQMRTISL